MGIQNAKEIGARIARFISHPDERPQLDGRLNEVVSVFSCYGSEVHKDVYEPTLWIGVALCANEPAVRIYVETKKAAVLAAEWRPDEWKVNAIPFPVSEGIALARIWDALVSAAGIPDAESPKKERSVRSTGAVAVEEVGSRVRVFDFYNLDKLPLGMLRILAIGDEAPRRPEAFNHAGEEVLARLVARGSETGWTPLSASAEEEQCRRRFLTEDNDRIGKLMKLADAADRVQRWSLKNTAIAGVLRIVAEAPKETAVGTGFPSWKRALDVRFEIRRSMPEPGDWSWEWDPYYDRIAVVVGKLTAEMPIRYLSSIAMSVVMVAGAESKLRESDTRGERKGVTREGKSVLRAAWMEAKPVLSWYKGASLKVGDMLTLPTAAGKQSNPTSSAVPGWKLEAKK